MAEAVQSLTPAQLAHDEELNRTPANLAELDREIARTRDGKARAILQTEKVRILAGMPENKKPPIVASKEPEKEVEFPFPLNMIPSAHGEGKKKIPLSEGEFSLEDAYGGPSDKEEALASLRKIGPAEFQEHNLFMNLGAMAYKFITGQKTQGTFELGPEGKKLTGEDLPWYKYPGKLVDSFKDKPLTTLVDLGKGVLYDPELLFAMGIKTPQILERAGALAQATGRGAKGAAVGGAIGGAASSAQQAVQKDEVNLEEVGGAALTTAAMMGPLSMLGGGKAKRVGEPSLDEWMNGKEAPLAPEPRTPGPDNMLHPDFDKRANAEARAYKLMQKGASKRTVEAVRARDPYLGEVLDGMMARRGQSIGAMKDTLQGEVLPPEAEAAVAAAKLTSESQTPRLPNDFVANAERLAKPAAAVIAGVGAADYVLHPENREQYESLAAMGAIPLAGAVKGKGGMWHPEAVTRLATPLKDSLTSIRDITQRVREEFPGKVSNGGIIEDGAAQARFHELLAKRDEPVDRMIRNYLNKHAGTEGDPLKDVEIPFGEGTARWEKLWDASIMPDTLKNTTQAGLPESVVKGYTEGKISGNEPVFDFSRSPYTQREFTPGGADAYAHGPAAITSYLSHVGDYLRQNVDPSKLPQYDLVRAVKETAANDARVAKEMEKASAASTKDLPVYKEYPDGMKWVELKLPEKLTPDQEKGLKLLEGKEAEKFVKENVNDYDSEWNGESIWAAVDAQGKPIENSYTGEGAFGPSKEQAFLAGQLAQEGNQMGHCVGGYCEGVASGESRIFSLRDKKGKSHVTVEVTPPDVRAPHNSPEHFAKVVGGAVLKRYNELAGTDARMGEVKANREIIEMPEYQKWLSERPTDIQQIKGKQNRAPVAEYLPYVQDFVKSGKWGEVGDLGNTGLHDISKLKEQGDFQKTIDRLVSEGNRFATKEDITGAATKDGVYLPRNQRGSIDADLAKKLALISGGAIAGAALTDDKIEGALLGGILGLGAGLAGRGAVKDADKLLGVLSTRIRNISEGARFRLVQYEKDLHQGTHEALLEAEPFFKKLGTLRGAQGEQLNRAILTNDSAKVDRLLKSIGDPELSEAWRGVRGLLDKIGVEHQKTGRLTSLLEGYFPRVVTDRPGLMEALGAKARGKLEEQLQEAERAAVKAGQPGLSAVEESTIINKYLQRMYHGSGGPGFAKKRTIEEVTEKLEPFYASPLDSLNAYIHSSMADIAKARFFGKDLVRATKDGRTQIDLDESIGNLVRRELREGKIQPEQVDELNELLSARFSSEGRGTSPLVQDVKNLANAGLLGNVISAGTQLGDTATVVYSQGLRSTLNALARKLTGRAEMSVRDFGIADKVAEEFTSERKSARFLNGVFKYGLFSAVDRFGKDMLVNAAWDKYTRQAKSERGVKEIERKYGEALGEEFPQLIEDLRTGKHTDLTDSVMFAELSDVQPVTKSEMPEAYLKMPNGRVIYMLKTFMLKQADLVRRDAYNEIKEGNVSRGTGNLLKYAVALGMGGMATQEVKNWLMGLPSDPKPGDAWDNVLKTFGWSQYAIDKAQSGKPLEAAAGTVAPPFQMFDDILRRDPKALQYIPVLGKLYYYHFEGGKEAAEQSKEKAEKRREKEESMDAADRALRRERSLQRRRGEL